MNYKFCAVLAACSILFCNTALAKKDTKKEPPKPAANTIFTAVNTEAAEAAKTKAKVVTCEELKEICDNTKGPIKKLYLHWTAHNHKMTFKAYHINITGDGQIVMTCNKLTDLKPHTWRRNTEAVGISMCAAKGSRLVNYKKKPFDIKWGKYPPTQAQINTMAKVVAILSDSFNIEINKKNVMTHYEAAIIDHYAPGDLDYDMRWDLSYIVDPELTDRLVPGGDVIRYKAMWYKLALKDFKPETAAKK